MPRVDVEPDTLPPEQHRHGGRCPGTHEGVERDITNELHRGSLLGEVARWFFP